MQFQFIQRLNACLPSCGPLFTAGLFAASVNATHAAVAWHDIQFGGFISQGYLISTDNNYPVDTKGGTTDFREMALRASTTFGPHLRAGAQVFAQTLGKYGDDKILVDWAVLDYNVRPEFGIRAGRVKYPRSLHSEVLDADELRPFILLPQSIYDARLRDVQASFDGAMAYGTFGAGKASLDYKVFYGRVPMEIASGVGDFFNTQGLFAVPPGITKLIEPEVYGAALTWNTTLPGLRFGFYYSRLADFQGEGPLGALPIFPVNINLKHIDYTGVSAEYVSGNWTLTGEYLIDHGDVLITVPSFLAPPTRADYGNLRYYFSVARRLNEKFEVGTYFSHLNNRYAAAPSSRNSRSDIALSVRYDANSHLIFKLEAHVIRGTQDIFDVPGISNPPSSLQHSMMLFAAKATLSF